MTIRRTVSEASLCVQRCARWGVNRGASSLYLEWKPEESSNQVNNNAPFGLVAKGIEFRTIAVAIFR